MDEHGRQTDAAAVLQAAFLAHGLHLTLVGGSAVAAWAPDAHVSLDIDFVGSALQSELDAVLHDLFGMAREGRHWYDEQLGIAVEVPGTYLEPAGASAAPIETPGGRSLVVISLEDLALDRVEQWAATGALDVWAQAVALVQHDLVDRAYLVDRAERLGLERELEAVEWLAEERAEGREIGSPELHAAQRAARDGPGEVSRAVQESRDGTI